MRVPLLRSFSVSRGSRRLRLREVLVSTTVLVVGALSGASAVVPGPVAVGSPPAPLAPPQSLLDTIAVPWLIAAPRASEDRVAPNGTPLFKISSDAAHDLPRAARRAYVHAAAEIERSRPGCHLYWELLAGIGRVESDHGRYGGSVLGTDGVSHPPIRGIALDGRGPVAAIADTDQGRLDGDPLWDRAIGPLQFLPSTWRRVSVDGDGDGVADPDDLDDAALAAAAYLCPASGPLTDVDAMRAAVYSYNHSEYYVDLVMAFTIGYHTGVFDIPPPPAPEPTLDRPGKKDKRDRRDKPDKPDEPRRDQPTTTVPHPTQEPTDSPSDGPSSEPPPHDPGGPTPSEPPSPDPERVQLSTATGPWTACAQGWCLLGFAMDLGAADQIAAPAAADFDGDGTTETNDDEFVGLEGSVVTVQVARGTNVVYTINAKGYRNADGSFSQRE